MKEIALTNSPLKAIVDDEWYDYLMQWKWQLGTTGDAIRTARIGEFGKPTQSTVRMHRVVNGTPDGLQTDHRNLNRLDNRTDNLRTATPGQNCGNTPPLRKRADRFSQYKGVCFYIKTQKWRAHIRKDNVLKHLGYFEREIDAAKAYNAAALRVFGEFARLNPV